ncbi:MAG: DUF5686 family protein [Sphingobacteriaceae bacterium]|nr:DUF5686 family protein [Sphingobacteriaceae bacterium]
MTQRIWPWLLLLFTTFSAQAQYLLEGEVVDADNKQPLPFVNMLLNEGKTGVITDINGRFRINHPQPIRSIKLSYVGYEMLTYSPPEGRTKVTISLTKKAFGLQEVSIIAGENPAHRVIQEAVRRRNDNHPEKLNSFRYTAYNRFVVTIDTSKQPLVDTISTVVIKRKDQPDSLIVDSSDYEFARFLRARDLFLSESVSEKTFRAPDISQEKIVATRTSGVQNPIFLLLSSQFQSFSFYNDYISILSIRYLNPISPGSTSKYFFQLQDTLYDGRDSVFVISFEPRKSSNISGMKGLLYIHTQGYALQNVLAEPADSIEGFQMRIRQHYDLIEGQRWFPTQLNTTILLLGAELDGLIPVAIANAYLSNIEINPPVKRGDISLNGSEVQPDATKKPDAYWEEVRRTGLSERDWETYRFIDSISTQFKLERRFRFALAVSTGRLPIGPIDLRLRDILSGNRYEGLRLGMGVATNDKVSRWFSVGGYAAYGFRDRQGKYGLNTDFFFDPRKKYSLSFFGHNDLLASGGYQLFNNHTGLINTNPDQLTQFFTRYFDREQALGARFRFLNVRYLSGDISFKGSYRQQTPWFHYRYLPLAPGYPTATLPEAAAPPAFNYREAGVQLRYAFREKTLRMADREITVESRYPVVYLNYQKGFEAWGGDFDYHRLLMRVEKDFIIRNAGVFTAVGTAGAVFSNSSLPLQQLFFMRGTGRTNGFMVPLNFQTFDMNDYAGNRFAQLHLRHNFESLLFKTTKQQPIFALHHNSGISFLDAPGDHYFTDQANFVARVADMRLGYHESGMSLTNILLLGNRWGVGLFYRYGPYSASRARDNFAIKLALTP